MVMDKIKINIDYKNLVGLAKEVDAVNVSNGLEKHLKGRRHEKMIPYLEKLDYLLNHPDYVGKNPKQPDTSFECIKVIDENVLVAVKLDKKRDYYFVASVYDVTQGKLDHMIESGRVRKVDK